MPKLLDRNNTYGQNITVMTGVFLESAYNNLLEKEDIDTLFSLNGNALIGSDLNGANSLLPVFAWYADKIHDVTSGFSMGIGFKEDKNAITGYKVNLDCGKESTSEILLYITDALFECRNACPPCEKNLHAVDIAIVVSAFKDDMKMLASQHNKSISNLIPS